MYCARHFMVSLVRLEPNYHFDKLILHPKVKTDIPAGLRSLKIHADLRRVWNLGFIQPQQVRNILNF